MPLAGGSCCSGTRCAWLEDHSPRQASFKTRLQDRFLFWGFSVMTRLSRHVVVAPNPAAPLLTDTSRPTVGSGTREDKAQTQLDDTRHSGHNFAMPGPAGTGQEGLGECKGQGRVYDGVGSRESRFH